MDAEQQMGSDSSKTNQDSSDTKKQSDSSRVPAEVVIPPMSASECRNLVRVLVMGAKSVAQNLSPIQQNGSETTRVPPTARPSESEIVQMLRDLLYYGTEQVFVLLFCDSVNNWFLTYEVTCLCLLNLINSLQAIFF